MTGTTHRLPLLATVLLALLAGGAARAQQLERETTFLGRPNLNGIWQVLGTANWNLEAHSAELPADSWRQGAKGAVPAGPSMLRGGGAIPYLPEARARRDANRAAADHGGGQCHPRFIFRWWAAR